MDFEDRPAVYRFDRFVLDLVRGTLLADGTERALRPKSFALLRHLVANAERLIGRDEIMQAVWPGVFVTDDSIGQCIKEIRRALDDDQQRLLRTLPRRGYLFAVPAPRADEADVSASHAAAVRTLPAPPTNRPMVVVLPIGNIGGDPNEGYFADGLTADLVTDLTHFQDLHIVSPQRHNFGPLSAPGAGVHEAGVAELRLAVSLNPLHPPFWWATLGRALLLAGHPHEAVAELRRCAALAPDYRPCYSSMVVASVEAGRLDEARAAMREVLRLRPGWVLRDYDGVFGLRKEADTARFLAAFRAAGMPEA